MLPATELNCSLYTCFTDMVIYEMSGYCLVAVFELLIAISKCLFLF